MSGDNIKEQYEYKTSILTAYDGTEQRIKTRQHPRHIMNYEYHAMNTFQAQWLQGMSRMRQSDLYYVPMWHNVACLTEEFIGGKALYIGADYMYSFRNCDWIEIYFMHSGVNIVRQVYDYRQSDDGGVILLKDKIDRKLNPLNTWIFPLRQCSIKSDGELSYIYSAGTNMKMEFEDVLKPTTIDIPYSYISNFDTDIPLYNLYHMQEKYNDKLVFMFTPKWVDDSDTTISIDKNINRLDNESGVFTYDLKTTNSYDTNSWQYTLMNKKSINNMIKFFDRVGGMFKSFYCPSWVNDLEPCKDLKYNTNYIYTKFNKLYNFYFTNGRKKSIIIFTNDYKSYIYDISSWNYETVNKVKLGKVILQSPISVSIPLSNIRMISFFNLVRFNSDTLSLGYENTDIANVTLGFKEVDI